MTFSNPLFFLGFLPLVLLGYAILSRLGPRVTMIYLALASLLFYERWSSKYLLVLVGSVAMNFCFAALIARCAKSPRRQRWLLVAGIAANLGALCYFKYFFPFLNYTYELGWTHHPWGSTVLPLGISFFTFTQIAYLVDLKESTASLEGLDTYTLFVTFFPHLVAGPILHHSEMMPQFRAARRGLQADDVALGLTWFTMGFFKKTVVADRIAPVADVLFAAPHAAGAWQSWHGAVVYVMQLYFDFSGYSDMAIGLARMFSIRFPMNFNSPYKAVNVRDYWQRWHMTLTRYIMAYLYGPVQMWVSRRRLAQGKKVSRKAQATLEGVTQMVALPTIFTMLIAGIWHGAGWQFLVFGLMHGVYLTVNHAWDLWVPQGSMLRRWITTPVAVVMTFLCVLMADVMFRADSLHGALTVYAGLAGRHGVGTSVGAGDLALLAGLFAVVWLMPNTQEILGETLKNDESNWSVAPGLRWHPSLPWWILTAGALILCIGYCSAGSTFLYFQF